MVIQGWLSIAACQTVGAQLRVVPVPGGLLFRALATIGTDPKSPGIGGLSVALQFIPCSDSDRDLFIKENCSAQDGVF